MNRLLFISAIAALLGSALVAQQRDPRAATTNSSLSSSDRTFVQDAAKGNQDEVAWGQLAEQKTSNSQVKNLAQKVASDHMKAQQQLENLASKQGVTVENYKPNTTSEYSKLSNMSGAEFDRNFAAQMVQDHQKAISMFEKELKSTNDPELKAWINDTLPALRMHLTEAQTLERSLGKG
ncbi:MAG TPA: DUF4142 domain-containing protein [Bryobacteraceae bacterium]|jgi:putative membrane protein